MASGAGWLPHGYRLGPHTHDQGQLVYAAAGTPATTTERGTWVAPANRVTWTPPGFAHGHRFYGRSDARLLTIPLELCGQLAGHPSVFADLLHSDPARPATPTELGRAAGASERTLSRLFHTEPGMSFHRWRTLLRIQHALAHLTNGMSVTEWDRLMIGGPQPIGIRARWLGSGMNV
ncbi:AraC family transcriptional regulator [Embleya sp. NPDC005971]|uniref:AraC family transcriptional regulator n=1 Tax=Embleya sp. NPDC005971 TaxID=3156724 RepID=UPI0033FE1FC0